MRSTFILLCATGILIATSPAWADSLATFDFLSDGQPLANGRLPNTIDADLTALQGLTRGAGIAPATTARVFSSDQWGDNNNAFAAFTTKDDAIAGGDFITMAFEPTSGNAASYASLDYKIRRTSSGPTKFVWQYQVGVGTFQDVGTEVEYLTNDTSGLFQPQLDLSTIAALQNVSDAVTFRYVAWSNPGTGSIGIGRNVNSTTAEDVLFLTGTVSPIGGTILAGDFNDDKKVDAADYTVWRDKLGTTEVLPNDDTPGNVDSSDYDDWKANFGASAPGAGSATGSSGAVPEPASVFILLIGLSAVALARPRMQRRNCR